MQGLTTKEVNKRLEKYGKNEIIRKKKLNPLKILLSQFRSPLILLLIAAAIISILLGYLPNNEPDYIDAILIIIIVFATGISGFIQDYKAERSIEALQKMATPTARVLRDNKEHRILVTELVPGDILILESGDIVPADAKLIEAHNLQLDESILTGESLAISKKINQTIYMNTSIFIGTAKALISKTGMKTKVGEIASKLETIQEESSPFEQEMQRFGKKIFWLTIGITILLFIISLFKYDFSTSLLTSISLAVAAIPEGLPAVIVLALALGAKVMANKKALIRKLGVTESIGAVDIICTDKTGTLTKNEMTVTNIFANNKLYNTEKIKNSELNSLNQLFLCSSLCNNSTTTKKKDENNKEIITHLGDQTEIALRKISDKYGFKKEDLMDYKRKNEIPFTSNRKMMSIICSNKKQNKKYIYTKGAPEILIEHCNKILYNNKIIKLTPDLKKTILEQNKSLASNALRILGFAYRQLAQPSASTQSEHSKGETNKETNLIWLGLQAMIDPPREEVKQAISECKSAGIRVIMITGDNALTAKAIADKVGIHSKDILEGSDIEKLTKTELEKKLNQGVNIFARTNPFHKLKILEILQKDNRVAMTGDGVNDALAIKKADVGIAMGIRGTDVSKQASDIILLDDNFATIVNAVKEGRRIFNNIRKFVNYLFTCNLAEVGIVFLSTLFLVLKQPILLPVQILWINLLTDGFPALALGTDKAKRNIMKEPPRKKDAPILNKQTKWLIVVTGLKMIIVLFAIYFLTLPLGLEKARTVLFTGFIIYEFIRIASIRYQEQMSIFSNKLLVLAVLVSLTLHLIIIYTPLNQFFQIVPLGLFEWFILFLALAFGYITSLLITKEVLKYIPAY